MCEPQVFITKIKPLVDGNDPYPAKKKARKSASGCYEDEESRDRVRAHAQRYTRCS